MISATEGMLLVCDLEEIAEKYFGGYDIKAMNDLHSFLGEMVKHGSQESLPTKDE